MTLTSLASLLLPVSLALVAPRTGEVAPNPSAALVEPTTRATAKDPHELHPGPADLARAARRLGDVLAPLSVRVVAHADLADAWEIEVRGSLTDWLRFAEPLGSEAEAVLAVAFAADVHGELANWHASALRVVVNGATRATVVRHGPGEALAATVPPTVRAWVYGRL